MIYIQYNKLKQRDKNIVFKDKKIVEKCEQKKEQNTADIISRREQQAREVC